MKTKLNVSKMWLLFLAIPFVVMILVIIFRHGYYPTNEEIIDYVKNAEAYSSKVEYKIKNSKGEYTEDTKIYYCKEQGMRIEFGQDRVKIYKDGFINMNDNGDEYELEGNFDEVYPLAFLNNLLLNDVQNVTEASEEWGDIKYLELNVSLPFKNKHLTWAKLYINKLNNTPILAKIYDDNNDEKLTIVYKDFEYLDEIDKELF